MDLDFIAMDLEFEKLTNGIVGIIKVWGKFSLHFMHMMLTQFSF